MTGNRSEAARLMGSVSTPAKAAAARENGLLGGRPPRDQRGIARDEIRVAGETVKIVRKAHSGLKTTHNHDGRYNLVWAVDASGRVYRTSGRKGGAWRPARPEETPPAELMA